jgi:hypothetical protein
LIWKSVIINTNFFQREVFGNISLCGYFDDNIFVHLFSIGDNGKITKNVTMTIFSLKKKQAALTRGLSLLQ